MAKNRNFSEAIIQEWGRLYLMELWSTCDIAEKYKCSQTTIKYHFKKIGVKCRSRKEIANFPHIKKRNAESHKGNRHSEEVKQKMSKDRKGKYVGVKNGMFGRRGGKHPNWQGGISFLPYAFRWTKELRLKIKVRDDFTCQHPNKDCRGCLGVHHIDYNKMNCEENNLITLCRGHNAGVNFNRERWTKYFQNKLRKVS